MEKSQYEEVFCIGCYGWQKQLYGGILNDGDLIYKKYTCCQCGCENKKEYNEDNK